MELEMKYAIPDKETADAIWDEDCLRELADSASLEKLVMKAVYFDTEDRLLSKNDMSVRVRLEGESIFATLKWGGHVSNGFHERQEINVPVSGEQCFIVPPTDVFSESEDGKVLKALIGEKHLQNMLETRYLRRRMRISYQDSILELAIDTGAIITDAGELPILELELELFAGDPSAIKSLGQKLEQRFSLVPENRSKLARGLSLLSEAAK